MPPSLPHISGADTIRALQTLGFTVARQKGSHVVLKKQTDSGDIGCVVPLHKELAIGTLSGILKQANVSPEEFMEKL